MFIYQGLIEVNDICNGIPLSLDIIHFFDIKLYL